jgi:hypothetical protein
MLASGSEGTNDILIWNTLDGTLLTTLKGGI